MNETQQTLLALMADGRVHSGQQLGEILGISRAAVWKQLHGLERLGLQLESVPGQGHRLNQPLELLDAHRIAERLGPQVAVEVAMEIDSTNAELLRRARSGEIHGQVLMAEFQQSGRGRRGRGWLSPFGSGLCVSLGCRFETGLSQLGGLSLALGVAASQALEQLGVDGIRLKWPNDLLLGDRKLAGILVEIRGEFDGPCQLVAGIGINVSLPEQQRREHADLSGFRVGRNDLAVELIHRWYETLAAFEHEGFAPWAAAWDQKDGLRGQTVVVETGGESTRGVVAGVDESGALRLETDSGMRRFVGGEVSVRREHAAV